MNKYLHKTLDFKGDAAGLLELFSDEPHVFFLDSSQCDPHRGRYSFIGFDPFDVFIHKGKDALTLLKEKFAGYVGKGNTSFSSSLTPLTAGVVGCLGYDYGLHQERIQLQAKDDLHLPDAFFGFYDCILTINHFTQKLHVTSSGLPEKDEHLRQARAAQRLTNIIEKLAPHLDGIPKSGQDVLNVSSGAPLDFKCNFSREQYLDAVQKALDHISCGDIYQVNLSQRFEFNLDGHTFNPLTFYRALRNLSPSPFGGYLDGGDFHLISNSPERFLHLNNGVVQTRPMKGTRPRGGNASEDQKMREEILNSAKEKAELLMITDLQRNDLGRVCKYGSVHVKEMRTLEEYQYVFQATSTVEGVLGEGKDCFDLIQACFPGGSITGCPKIRAMEIVEELEPTRRAMYTGSLGYINFDGNMDFNILIRTLVTHRNKLYFQVGGGVVTDSTPENEYDETLVKARAMRACLEQTFAKDKCEVT